MKSLLTAFAAVIALLAGDGLTSNVDAAVADHLSVGVDAAVDFPAPESWSPYDSVRRGGEATRVELVGDGLRGADSSAWYRLAYVDGGTRLQVFEHYAVARHHADADMIHSQVVAWRIANQIVAAAKGAPFVPHRLPEWARAHTGSDTGGSAGLMFVFAYLDVLTSGALVGDLRVAGSGGIGLDGVVTPVDGIEAKVAAALLTHPGVVFTSTPPGSVKDVTVVESMHTRTVDAGFTVAQWLNLAGYEQAGRAASTRPGAPDVVVVHGVRQALAYLCGRTRRAEVCDAAGAAATIPISPS